MPLMEAFAPVQAPVRLQKKPRLETRFHPGLISVPLLQPIIMYSLPRFHAKVKPFSGRDGGQRPWGADLPAWPVPP